MKYRIVILAAIPVALFAFCAFRDAQAPHPAVEVLRRWTANAPWALLSHTEPRWGDVHGHAGWIVRARCRDAEGREREWWLLIRGNGVSLAAPVDARSEVLRQTAAAFEAAYGADG